MAAATRLKQERNYHDCQARDRALTFDRDPNRLRFTDADYLGHESWVRPAFAQLGDVRGKRVLDLGCGHGMASVVLARRGALVTACDLSPGYCAEARRRAKANHLQVDVIAADCERLPFVDQSFDAIWGHAILHHLDVAVAAREIRRVVRPVGAAVLCEPWDGNPILRLLRRWRCHTEAERPLNAGDVRVLRQVFQHVELRGFQLAGMLHRSATTIDAGLLRALPALRHWCRYVVIQLH